MTQWVTLRTLLSIIVTWKCSLQTVIVWFWVLISTTVMTYDVVSSEKCLTPFLLPLLHGYLSHDYRIFLETSHLGLFLTVICWFCWTFDAWNYQVTQDDFPWLQILQYHSITEYKLIKTRFSLTLSINIKAI